MRVLFLTQRLPYAPNRGDRVRAYHELKVLSTQHEVHVASLVHDEEEAGHVGALDSMAASVTVMRVSRARNLTRAAVALLTPRPLTHVLLDARGARRALARLACRQSPDIVLAYCSSMARFALEPPLSRFPFLLDMVDVDSAKWAALSKKAASPRRLVYAREARCLGRFEALAARRALRTFVVNEREAAELRRLAGPRANVTVMQNGVDLEALRPGTPEASSSDVVFCGVMDYEPNEAGALWLVREVWPLVLASRPDARLVIVGARPTRRLLSVASRSHSVVVTGSVGDVRPYLWRAAVSAAPLLVSRGVQNKVLEAVAAGLPAVVTNAVAEGLPAEVMPACRSAASAPEFAAALVDVLALAPAQRRALALSAPLDAIAWERQLAPLLEAICGSAQQMH